MKILFLISEKINGRPVEHVYGCSYALYPTPDLATLYNAAVLKQAGHQVSLFRISEKTNFERIPRADLYLMQSVILSKSFDIEVGRKLQRKKVFYFGPAPTLDPEDYLTFEKHFVLRGETEHFIAKAIESPIDLPGVSYKKGNQIFHNPTAGIIKSLDSLAFPARELDPKNYFNPKLNFKKATAVLSTRGCANRCYFCVPHSISWARELEWKKFFPGKPPVTARSAENVIFELKLIKKKGYQEFSFIDDQFIVDKKRVLKILAGIKKLKMPFGILARADRLDEEIVRALSSAGCLYVDIGVESFDQEILEDIRKDLKLNTIYQAIDLLCQYDIEPKLNIMFGTSEKETRAKIEKTIKTALELPIATCMFSIATPYPGTDFAKLAAKKGFLLKNKKLNPLGNALVNYPHLSAKKLEQLTRKANKKFYLRRSVVIKHLRKIRTMKSAKQSFIFLNNFLRTLK